MKLPLVSIAVVTYNSSKTVLETLDSIKEQTYPNIELIISDDCSKDNTVELCRGWVEKNKGRFVRVEILTVETNTGVSANFNRADAASRGEWGKPIAGDDLLLPNAIQEYVNYIIVHPDVVYVFANGKCFGSNEEYTRRIAQEFTMDFFKWDKQKQLEYLCMLKLDLSYFLQEKYKHILSKILLVLYATFSKNQKYCKLYREN